MREKLVGALLALVFTHLFFFEYRTGDRRVHIPYDLEGYHYPLADYAFQSLKQGRFPEWDPTMYSGIAYAGNINAALFYPPMWAVLAANTGNPRLHYATLQDAVFLHMWATFVLAWCWLSWKQLHPVAALLGAMIFAFSGYVLHQLQHFGLIAGYTWLPLGFWAIDARRYAWLAVASAMCFLAGYTPFWGVFVTCMIAYAMARKQLVTAMAGIAVSCGLVAVQLLPAMEASALMVRDYRYGTGITDPLFYLSYLVPNYFNFDRSVPVATNYGYDLLYLGGAGITGAALCLGSRRGLRASLPAFAVLGACLFFATNPFHIVSTLLERWPLGAQVIRDYYFLAGITAAIAILAASGLHEWLVVDGLSHRPSSATLAGLAVTAAAVIWSVHLYVRWKGTGLASGAASAWDAAAAVVIITAAVALYPRSGHAGRIALGAAMLLLTATEYKVFGVAKRVNAGDDAPPFATEAFPGLDDEVYRQISSPAGFRCALAGSHPSPASLRHAGLTTPQGFDPLLPTNYQRLIQSIGHFRTDREFDLDLFNEAGLQLLGVKYVISFEGAPVHPRLLDSGAYRLLEPSTSYYKVFEYLNAKPPYGWEPPATGTAVIQDWAPERRRLAVSSTCGGTFRLSEQYAPGWTASVGGKRVDTSRCHETFQCVTVPAGSHVVEFQYASLGLRLGLAITAATLAVVLYSLKLTPSRVIKSATACDLSASGSPSRFSDSKG